MNTHTLIPIAAALLGALSYWHSTVDAKREAAWIARNIAHGVNDELPHDELLFQRMLWVGSPWMAVALPLSVCVAWWAFLPLAGVAWSLYTMRHRYALNGAREYFPWWYVADGNAYDRIYLSITVGRVKTAGLLAYAVEAAVLAGSVVVMEVGA